MVIIKDMIKPKLCVGCEFSKFLNNTYIYCSRHPMEPYININDKIPKHCPLEPIKK